QRAAVILQLGEAITGVYHQQARGDVDHAHRGEQQAEQYGRQQLSEHSAQGRSPLARPGAHRIFSTARRRALRAPGLRRTSASEALSAWPVSSEKVPLAPQAQTGRPGGQVHRPTRSRNASFTLRSSSEWKAIAAALPPTLSRRGSAWSTASSTSSSRLTAMRRA